MNAIANVAESARNIFVSLDGAASIRFCSDASLD